MKTSPFTLLTVLAALSPSSWAQSTWYVDPTGVPPGTGTMGSPYTSLQFAIEQASTLPGDELLLQPGTYAESVNLSGKELRIIGLQGPDGTILDAGGSDSALIVEGGEGPGTTIEGLTITGGRSSVDAGDGIRIGPGSSLTLRACHVRDNAGGEFHRGNGIYVEDGVLHAEDCVISGNAAGPLPGNGAGIYAESAQVTLTQTLFDSNFAAFGGGICQRAGDVRIEDCVFRNCIADTSGAGTGGAIVASPNVFTSLDYLLEIDGCLFEGGYAYDSGGAIQLNADSSTGTGAGGQVTIRHSTFVENSADLFGGAISSSLSAPHLLLEDCAFVRNSLTPAWNWAGSAIALGGTVRRCTFYDQLRGSTVNLGQDSLLENCVAAGNLNGSSAGPRAVVTGGIVRNCILWNNEGPELSNATSVMYSNVQGGSPGTGNIDMDPRWVQPQVGDFRLRPLSPCIDAGDPSSALDADGTLADLGPFPYNQSIPCPQPEIYCIPKQHSGGCEPTLAWNGSAGASGRDDFVVLASQLLPGQFSLAFVSPQPNQTPLFGGTRCTGGDAVRFGPYSTGPGVGSCDGSVEIPIDQSFLQSYAVGSLLHVQLLFRDPGFVAPDNVSMTGGLRFVVCP